MKWELWGDPARGVAVIHVPTEAEFSYKEIRIYLGLSCSESTK